MIPMLFSRASEMNSKPRASGDDPGIKTYGDTVIA